MNATAPRLQQCVVALERVDYNKARMNSPELLVNPFITVVPVPLRPPESDNPALQALQDALRPSTVLIRNRWDGGSYVDAAAAYERISLAKFNIFANVCQMLGATRLEALEIREVADNGKVRATIDFRADAVRGDVSLESDSLRRLAQAIRGEWVWQSGGGDVSAAETYAVEKGILADPVVSNLIQQRKFTASPLTEHTLELDISSEARQEVSATLKMESVLRKLGPSFEGTFTTLRTQSQRIWLRVYIAFPAHG